MKLIQGRAGALAILGVLTISANAGALPTEVVDAKGVVVGPVMYGAGLGSYTTGPGVYATINGKSYALPLNLSSLTAPVTDLVFGHDFTSAMYESVDCSGQAYLDYSMLTYPGFSTGVVIRANESVAKAKFYAFTGSPAVKIKPHSAFSFKGCQKIKTLAAPYFPAMDPVNLDDIYTEPLHLQ